MKLAFCIPTHHGRRDYLKQLIDSIYRQQKDFDPSQVQICISDNASNDQTSQMVAALQATSPIAVKYHRFPVDMRGVHNTTNVIAMANAEYCWLLGSDDVIIDGGIAKVLATLTANPGISGITVNKVNLNRDLDRYIGPDPLFTLPSHPLQSRRFDTFEAAIGNVGNTFFYMSAHIFRQELCKSIIESYGVERLKWTRHFSHAFLMAQMLKQHPRWYWIGDYCVVQRLDNYCLMEEKENVQYLYASEILEDSRKVWESVLNPTSFVYRRLMTIIFISAWNPGRVLQYRTEASTQLAESRALTNLGISSFKRVPLFWMTTYFVLLIPNFILEKRAARRHSNIALVRARPSSAFKERLKLFFRRLYCGPKAYDLGNKVSIRQIALEQNWKREHAEEPPLLDPAHV